MAVRVLVLRALGLGDFLTSLPAMKAIRQAFHGCHVTLAAPLTLGPLVELSGTVDELAGAEPLATLDVASPDVAINLHGRGPESHRVLLATGPRRLIGFENLDVPESAGMPGWSAEEHEVDRWCRLLDESGIPAIRTQLRLPAPRVPPPGAAVGATLIHPGAAAASRRWPADRWVEVARGEVARGRRVAVSAGPGELELASAIAGGAGLGRDAVVTGGLMELAAAVAAARIVVCGDTGVAHLATALGTPSCVLFGPTPPTLWGPPRWHPHVALWAGRRGDPHADSPDEGLLDISPGQVLDALGAVRGLGGRSLN